MSLAISRYVLGPVQTNCYLAADLETNQSVVIDPPAGSRVILRELKENNLHLSAIWITHAHFDHIAGAAELTETLEPEPVVGIHPRELDTYRNGGGAAYFNFQIPPQPEPSLFFEDRQQLSIGNFSVEVRHCPGHSSGGQVIFYVPDAGIAFCGDVIFRRSIGRTDFPGGSHQQLMKSIRSQILTLPPQTRLLCGHGPDTTVGEEAAENPFL